MATITAKPNFDDLKNAEFLQFPFLHKSSHVKFISPVDVSVTDTIHEQKFVYRQRLNKYYKVLSCERLNALPYGKDWYCYKIVVEAIQN